MARVLGEPADQTTGSMAGSALQIVELGPGTGQITKHLPRKNLILVEINARFSEQLAIAFPDATVFKGSAVEFFRQTAQTCAVVTSIPLINNPEAEAIRQAVTQAYRAGIIKKLVTYSYGSQSPYAGCGFAIERQARFVALNLPPARVWLYA